MTRQGVILYGPPTSGKDTVTAALARQDERLTLLTKLKLGAGRSTGYRYVSPDDLNTLRTAGRLLVETHRYGNRYAVDRDDVDALTTTGRIPVAHMGNVADLQRLRAAVPLAWTAVLLWIPREVCAERSRLRGDADRPKRLQAWDETYADLQTAGETKPFDLTINTDESEPAEAARRIIETIKP
ncbi:guanylate kinase [Actinomadura xylanilytica]|uniref:guanylate kinase n=1 Tax=Actinomadura xylanilytica TaxID=887459 RepID=UPI00255AD8B4|nr:guanylate kinase [Actinomadura xylanilytica]MDL4773621.1 guanylate kinase [Actinomadura xylanilytica]